MAEVRGVSIVAGEASEAGPVRFRAFDPGRGQEIEREFAAATDEQIDRACAGAWEAFEAMAEIEPERRAQLLEAMASRIERLGDALVEVMTAETGLAGERVEAERDRATRVLGMFAGLVREGSWVRGCIEPGDAERKPVAKPDLRRMLRPLGPVAVFGASNFPIAYSTAGGDTASALAAGSPVVVKGHPLHPGTGELVAIAVAEAVRESGLPGGVFSFLHAGGEREQAVGERLMLHPAIRAAGFTGSFGGGTAMARLGGERKPPIPVFSEMGSTNPVFVLPGAAAARAEAIAEQLGRAVLAAVGQQCTCPGLVFVVAGEGAEKLEGALAERLAAAEPGVMLAPRIREGYIGALERARSIDGVETVVRCEAEAAGGAVLGGAALLRAEGQLFLREAILREEVFGPATVLIVCKGFGELRACAGMIVGSLTATVHMEDEDVEWARRLERVLEGRAGRVIFNGVPTGVEVNAAMVHGGPWPATTVPSSTAQGVMAMERWCRPVCWQNARQSLLPPELRDANPCRIEREVRGERTRAALAGARR